jgi:hypothetical protein
LPQVSEHLKKRGYSTAYIKIELSRYPDAVQHESVQDALHDILANGSPKTYTIHLGDLSVHRGRNIRGDRFQYLSLENVKDHSDIDSVMHLLQLEPDEPTTLPPRPARSAFIAHRFDEKGTEISGKLARFLELLEFRVVSGRAYAPGSVAEKVRTRIDEQAVLFVILTSGSDDTWLIQESIIANVKGKPIFVLKEDTATFKAGVLADHEYIPFNISSFESAFVPVLEGLRQLGYLEFSEK